MNFIDGKTFKELFLGGYACLNKHCKEINDLNVFPVPDGDTGFNMVETMKGGVTKINNIEDNSLSVVSSLISQGMLFAARGNSGVILSQFFAGLSDGIGEDKKESVSQFSNSLNVAIKKAYSVVNVPVEGTILTVMRVSIENSRKYINEFSTFEEYFNILATEMEEVVKETPNLLPVLKEANVVDSGGMGLLKIFAGMSMVLNHEEIGKIDDNALVQNSEISIDGFNEFSKLDYGYCTEFLFQLLVEKDGLNKFNKEAADNFLKTQGDSIVSFVTGTLVKVHIHTKTPASVISYFQQFGEFVKFKMENMTLQHNNISHEKKNDKVYEIASAAVSTLPFKNVFLDYGVTYVIQSGELLNPNVDQFVNFLNEIKAKKYIILPNNKNEILIAEQAKKISGKKDVYIIPTFDICSGIAVASILDNYNFTIEENIERGTNELNKINSLRISKAIKDSSLNNITVVEGDYVGFRNGKIVCSKKSVEECWSALLKICKEDNDELSLLTTYIFKQNKEGFAEILEEKALEIDDFIEFIPVEIESDSINSLLAIFE